MSIKRIAIAGIIAAALTLTACTGAGNQNPTTSPTDTATPTPTATSITGEAPADEDEAITKAEATIDLAPGETLMLYTDGLTERRGQDLDALNG